MHSIGKKGLVALAASLLLAGGAAARTFEEIAASKYLSICAAPDELPFSSNGGAPRGFYINIASRIAAELGLELKVDWIPNREKIRFTQCDALMGAALLKDSAGLESDPAKIHRTLHTIPYMTAMSVIVADKKIGGITALRDLQPYHVAVPSGSWAHKMLNENAVPVWVRFRTDKEIIQAVERGDAEAGIVSNVAIGWHRKLQGQTNLNVFPGVLDQTELGFKVAIGLRNTNLATRDKINAVLGKLIADGSVKTILAEYGIQVIDR